MRVLAGMTTIMMAIIGKGQEIDFEWVLDDAGLSLIERRRARCW
jgi:hypothetical protein